MKKTKIVVHCADTYARMDIGAAEIRPWHLARGFSDIGYAFVIRRNGIIEKGRDLDGDGDALDEVGAHAMGFNAESVGICLVGGKGENGAAENNFTPEQLRVLAFLIGELEIRFPGIELYGHRDLPGVTKACPAFDVRKWYREQKGVR